MMKIWQKVVFNEPYLLSFPCSIWQFYNIFAKFSETVHEFLLVGCIPNFIQVVLHLKHKFLFVTSAAQQKWCDNVHLGHARC